MALRRFLRLSIVPVVVLGLQGCGLGTSDEVTTQSVAPQPAKPVVQAPAEPDCATLKAEIDKLNAANIPTKFQQAAAKKYTPTQEEWGQFPRYNNLVDTYTVRKCQPALPVQADKKPPAKKPVVQKTAEVKSSKAPVAPKSPVAPTVAKTQEAPKVITTSIPPQPKPAN
jgi:hypothetical protein